MRIKKQIPRLAQTAQTRLPIIGKVKIGEKNERGLPTSLDYFRFDTQPIFGHAVQQALSQIQALGPKPTTLPILFCSEEEDFNLGHTLELRDQTGKLAYKTDLERIYKAGLEPAWEDITEQVLAHFSSIEAALPALAEKRGAKDKRTGKPVGFKERLTLRFTIPAMPIAGCWELNTGAAQGSIDGILQAYDAVKLQRGQIAFQPFFLSVKKVKSDRAEVSRQYPVLTLVPVATTEEQGLGIKLLSNPSQLLLGPKNEDV